ncbi:acetyltransferase-like isoleucine patch superfamily enzyme [Weissella uvarum]|nr:acetyltransferase-like isoleucine patch superfamily enzyme [Weissella uvarum]
MNKLQQTRCEFGNDVLIGAGAVVIKGVQVGKDAVVVAGTVVTQDVPENTFVGRGRSDLENSGSF